MEPVYVHVSVSGKRRKVARTVDLGNGVHVDMDEKAAVVGVEIINAKSVSIGGKKV